MPSPIQSTFNQNNQFPITTSKIEQKASPISQKNSFWSPAKIGIAAGAALSAVATSLGYLAYLNLHDKYASIDPPFSGTIPTFFAALFGAAACYAMTNRNSATTKTLLQKLPEEPATINSINKAKSQFNASDEIKKWEELSRTSGYGKGYEEIKLSSSEAKELYDIFKKYKDKFDASTTKVIEVPLFKTKSEGKNCLSVTFDIENYHDYKREGFFSKIDGEIFPLTRGQIKSLFAGFILSMDTTFFALLESRSHFIILKNIDGYTNEEITRCPGMDFYTRQGLQKGITNRGNHGEIVNSSKGSEWRIDSDGVCRLVEKNNAKDQPSSTKSNTLEEKSDEIEEIVLEQEHDANNNCKCIMQ